MREEYLAVVRLFSPRKISQEQEVITSPNLLSHNDAKNCVFLIACLWYPLASDWRLRFHKNIQNVQATGVHDSLAAALAHVNLITALSAEKFTFAPTDAAFTAAGIDLSTFDTDEENQTLRTFFNITFMLALLTQRVSRRHDCNNA